MLNIVSAVIANPNTHSGVSIWTSLSNRKTGNTTSCREQMKSCSVSVTMPPFSFLLLLLFLPLWTALDPTPRQVNLLLQFSTNTITNPQIKLGLSALAIYCKKKSQMGYVANRCGFNAERRLGFWFETFPWLPFVIPECVALSSIVIILISLFFSFCRIASHSFIFCWCHRML